MSLGSSEEALGHSRGLLGGNEEVLGALLGVNQNSFEDLACLVGAPRAQDPQNGAKGPVNGVGEARSPRPHKKGMPEAQKAL